MPPRKKERKSASAAAAAAVGGHDHISNLPDGVLQHMLSFVPAQDAVRTCVLAKRWRHLWKSTTALRFVCGGETEPESMEEIQEFVDHLLRLRFHQGTPLDTCEFRGSPEFVEENINFWIRIALQCKVRMLHLQRVDASSSLDDHPVFISQYLKKLQLEELDGMVPSRFLDFSCCPVLEDLEIAYCDLRDSLLISSQSLKHLIIQSCHFGDDSRIPICAPNLVSLRLVVRSGRTPLLQRMPSLLTASVKVYSNDDCDSLESDNDYSNQSILLQGLSEVQNLVLVSCYTKMPVFRKDLKFCSSFNKLKSLLLNEYWCEPADFSALACLLKLSPVLEKLTLQLYSEGPEHNVDIQLSCKPLEMSAAISQHLKTIEVKCDVYGKMVHRVLMFLSKLNICRLTDIAVTYSLFLQYGSKLYEWKCLDLLY